MVPTEVRSILVYSGVAASDQAALAPDKRYSSNQVVLVLWELRNGSIVEPNEFLEMIKPAMDSADLPLRKTLADKCPRHRRQLSQRVFLQKWTREL